MQFIVASRFDISNSEKIQASDGEKNLILLHHHEHQKSKFVLFIKKGLTSG